MSPGGPGRVLGRPGGRLLGPGPGRLERRMTTAKYPITILHDPTGDFSAGKATFGIKEFFVMDAPWPWPDGMEIERMGNRFCLWGRIVIWLPDEDGSRPTLGQRQQAILYAEEITGLRGVRATKHMAHVISYGLLCSTPDDKSQKAYVNIPDDIRDTILAMQREWLRERRGK